MSASAAQPRTQRAAAAESLRIDAATIAALAALDDAGIRALLLKGPAVADLLYDRGEERSWVDADLLVAPADHDAALAALAAVGFRPRIGDPLERGSVPYAVHLIREGIPAPGNTPAAESIDLHRGFAGVEAPAADLWASLSEDPDRIDLFGRAVEVPAVPARLALVALHAAAHGREQERSLRDVRRAVERFGEEPWARAADLARRWGALDFFVVGVGLVPAGPRLLGRIGVSHRPSRAALMRGAGMPRAQRGIEQLRRTAGIGAALKLIGRKLVPSAEVMRTWQPLARRGPGGLALAYAWRPLWLIAQLPPALAAYLRAGRG